MKLNTVKKLIGQGKQLQAPQVGQLAELDCSQQRSSMKIKIFGLLACLAALPVYAGGESGGGGDVVILPNDTVVLADPWIDLNSPQPNYMPPLRALNPRILQSVSSYLKVSEDLFIDLSPQKKSQILAELNKLSSRDTGLKFYAVKDQVELNDFCASGGRKSYKLPDGHNVTQAACTAGEETYLVEPLFERLSLRDQVLLLFHERLTTFRDQFGNKNYSAIAKITTGLDLYIELYKKEVAGEYPDLSESDVQKLTNLFNGIQEIEFRNIDPGQDTFKWIAWSKGGGRVKSSVVLDSSVLVTVSSVLGSIVGPDSKIINSTISSNVVIKGNALVKDSEIQGANIAIEEKFQMENSNILVGDGSLKIGNNVIMKNSRIIMNEARDDFMDIGDNQKLENGLLASDLQNKYFPLGVVPEKLTIEYQGPRWHLATRLRKDSIKSYIETTYTKSAFFHITSTVTRASLFEESYIFQNKLVFELAPKLAREGYFVLQDGLIVQAGYEKVVQLTFALEWFGEIYRGVIVDIENLILRNNLKYKHVYNGFAINVPAVEK